MPRPVLQSPKFEVLQEIGRGGMGLVYKVRHVALDTVLAVKVLSPTLADDDELAMRFEREARVMAKLRHENIVRVVDIDAHENVRFIVMELVSGVDLQNVLKTRGAFDLAETLSVARQVAAALAYAHTSGGGVIHRDIKPSNIILEEGTNRAVVTDFGIAKLMDAADVTRAGFMGTLRYSAPEQVRGDRIDGRADVYSLGLVIYEMLTGAPALGKLSASQIVARLLAPVEPCLEFPGSVPPEVRELIERATSRDRERRFANAAECLAEIDRLLEAERRRRTAVEETSSTGVSADDPWVLGFESDRTAVSPRGGRPGTVAAPQPAAQGRREAAVRAPVAPRAEGQRRRIQIAGLAALPLVVLAAVWLLRGMWAERRAEERQAPPAAEQVASPRTAEEQTAPPGEPRQRSGEGAPAVQGVPPAPPVKQEPAAPESAPPRGVEQPARRAEAPASGEEAAAKPAPPAVARVEPPPAVVQPPRIEDAVPEKRQLTLVPGEGVEFRARAVDGEGKPLALAWSVDGKPAGKEPTLRYQAPTGPKASNHTVTAEAVAAGGQRERLTWRLAVAAQPQAPRFVRTTPDGDSTSVSAGRPRLFAVDAEIPGADDPVAGLSYEWKLDGVMQDAHADRFELSLDKPGEHRLTAVVRGPGGEATHDWRVEVGEAAPPREASLSAGKTPPELEILDLTDSVSKNKRYVMVEGKIKNRGDAAVERLVVLVQAFDQEGTIVTEQDGVPAPQPLAPGEVATFRVRLENSKSIDGYRVQAFPR
jgi:predicted Ser/Thr protein kinase